MASKVEELLQEINDVLEDTASSLNPSRHRDFIGLDDVLEQLISAAREEGFEKGRAEGAEEARPKIAASTERLIQWILDMMPPYEGANPEWGRKVLLDLVATAAEQERERILGEAEEAKAEIGHVVGDGPDRLRAEMGEYTSLDVSRHLMKAGFKADIDGWHVVGDGPDRLPLRTDPFPPIDKDGAVITEQVPGYRADTLIEWLLRRKVAVFVDKRESTYYVYPFREEEDDCFASESLPDALGEVVLEVLAKEARE